MTIADKIELLYDEEYIRVISPRNNVFSNKAKRLRGKWDKDKKCWVFDSSLLDYVREAMIASFGTTGEAPYQLVNVVVSNYSDYTSDSCLRLLGYPILYNNGYGSIKQEDGVVILSGRIRSYKRGDGVSIDDAEIMLMGLPEYVVDTPEYKELQEDGCIRVQPRVTLSKLEYLQGLKSSNEKQA